MSIDVTFIIGKQEFCLPLPPEALDVLDTIGHAGYEEPVDAVIGDVKHISRDRLINAIDCLLKLLEEESDVLPLIYYVKSEWIRGSGNYNIGAGIATGIKIQGDSYQVEGGVNRCQLTRQWCDDSGKLHNDESIDIRDRKIIVTDPDGSDGDLEIIKTKRPLLFVDELMKLREILANAEGVTSIKKSIT